MNLLTIYPIQSCNLKCKACPMKNWTYPVDHELNKLNNSILLPWIRKWTNPYQWMIEISGGEPGLYPEISELVTELSNDGYQGLIKTNGILPIPKTEGFKRIAAWHTDIGSIPGYFDVILILRNPEDDWEAKVNQCVQQDIPYKTLTYRDYSLPLDKRPVDPLDEGPKKLNHIKNWSNCYSSGQLSGCSGQMIDSSCTIQADVEPIKSAVDIAGGCGYCPNVGGFEIFYSEEEWKKLGA